jgi:hypothetical protein
MRGIPLPALAPRGIARGSSATFRSDTNPQTEIPYPAAPALALWGNGAKNPCFGAVFTSPKLAAFAV